MYSAIHYFINQSELMQKVNEMHVNLRQQQEQGSSQSFSNLHAQRLDGQFVCVGSD
jgi:hypothetical protein